MGAHGQPQMPQPQTIPGVKA
ncbi:MAG: hypothetical protein JWM54_207, partial [Acidobacteriaceae bacterium]|nr:hypothetical protein [Acidobacteriaceae bacterium]